MEEPRRLTVEEYGILLDTYNILDNVNTADVDCFYCSNPKLPGQAYKIPHIDGYVPIKYRWTCVECSLSSYNFVGGQ